MLKKILGILITVVYFVSYAQENDKLCLYVKNKDFWPANQGYRAVLGFKSKDKRFSHDNYYFKINYIDLDYQSLYSLGFPVNIDKIKYIDNPIEYFKGNTNWQLHEKFSLSKSIFIVTEIPEIKLEKEKDKSKTYIMFSATYIGTQKNATWMNNTGKNFIED